MLRLLVPHDFGDDDRTAGFLHSAVAVNLPENARQTEWRAGATRVLGLVSLTFGCCLGGLIFVLLLGSPFPLWYPGLPLLATLLGLLLAANLIYIGWQTISTRSIPIRPRPPITRHNLSMLTNAIASRGAVSRVAWAVMLFGGCAAMGAEITGSYTKWANYLSSMYSGSNAPYELSSAVFGRRMAYIQIVKWLTLLFHFPISMSISIIGGTLLGLIRKRPMGNVAAAIGLLLVGPVASLMLWSWLVFALYMCRLGFLYYASYPLLPLAGTVFVDLSRTALLGSSDPKHRARADKGWSWRFLRTILIVGLPCGFSLGFILTLWLHDTSGILTGVETVCAALYGASLVNTDRKVSLVR